MKPNYLMSITLALAIAQPGAALARDNASVVYGGPVDPVERTELSDGSRTARVTFADLDLAQPAGETVLRKRIRIAVTYVCEAPMPEGYVSIGGGDLVCGKETRKVILPKVDAVIAAARSGKKLAFTSLGMVSR